MRPHKNFAARAGRWSAQHRRKAILGWLAFVVIATLAGGSIGTKTLALEDTGNGQSQVADRAIADAGFPDDAGEQVLVQARGAVRADDAAFAAAVDDVAGRLAAVPHVDDVESPLQAGNEGQISEDRRSAVLNFKLRGDEDQVLERVEATLRATAAAQAAHPDLRVEQFGDASATKALSDAFEEDFQRAESLSFPITLAILVLAFGALSPPGCRCCWGSPQWPARSACSARSARSCRCRSRSTRWCC